MWRHNTGDVSTMCESDSPMKGRGMAYALKFNLSPGLGHVALNSLPVADAVIHAVIMSAPPKQMLVTIRSGNG